MLSLVFAIVHASIFLESRIPLLSIHNYFNCKEQILLSLGYMELDLALYVDEPPTPMDISTLEERPN